MDKIRIRGGNRLKGTIEVAGAKNAALPLMAAALLSSKTLRLTNLPNLADIVSMGRLLTQHGLRLRGEKGEFSPAGGPIPGLGRTLDLTAAKISSTTAPYDLVRKMRASVLVLGPLVARAGRATVSLPGGCAIGARPVDLHLKALAELGAEIEVREGYIHATAKKGLRGAPITFAKVSVGATENLLMAATLAKGETVLANAAREPEIGDLARCLIAMGAKIEGIGSDTLHVQGVGELGAAEHVVLADRIEAGTFAIAAAITDGDLELLTAPATISEAVIAGLAQAGVAVEPTSRGVRVRRAEGRLIGTDIMTEPYPGFPTDLQAQFMSLMTVAEGASMITETIFENRFMHVPELARMGANINLHGSSAMVRGVPKLSGAPVMATDLRASVSLVLAGLVAGGETMLQRVYHLDRGYERLEAKLAACGADIKRVREAE
jgi:UDP-N-acetylglucosamine 1-carboxyvinyltransferase